MPDLTLAAVEDETARIRVFHFKTQPDVPALEYSAGAHLEFDLGDAGPRAYSLIVWPTPQDGYSVAVQREDSGQGGSKAMHALSVGDVVSASGPSNDFPLRDADGPVLLLAGGIGITPMISMATQLQAQNRPFVLHYAGRTAHDMGFHDRLLREFPGQTQMHYDDVSPVDLATLMAAQPKNTQLYICGPVGMIEAARAAAEQAGITDIYVELFATPETQEADAAFDIEIHDTGQVFTIPPGKTIIEVLEEAGIDLMFDCQRGDCGICQTDVIAGIPDHRDVVLSTEERAAGKVMQICVSRAKSDRLVLDL